LGVTPPGSARLLCILLTVFVGALAYADYIVYTWSNCVCYA